jgi:exodeoxyribonuclease-5
MTPTPAQAAAIRAIVEWYKGGRRTPQVFYLAGYAGTGKSTIFKAALEELREKGGLKKHALATFTGKAASVLRKKGNYEARTIHSLIYIRDESADSKWILNWAGEAADVDLIALDECSMVDEAMGRDVLAFGKKVLVMGDPGQLPPIRGQGFFTTREPDVFLEEVHRQAAESPIIRLATMAREGKQLPLGEWDAGELGCARVLKHGPETQRELYREETQALCGLHRVRIGYTQRIRRIRGFEGPRPMAGETLLVRKNDRELAIFNGTFAGLRADPRPYKRRAGDDESDAALIRLDIEPEDGAPIEGMLTDPYLFDRHFRDVQEPRFRKGIQWVDWGNVITMHSAQGSEWPDVTVVDDGGSFREDQHRWRYVGLTRASERVTFLGRMG